MAPKTVAIPHIGRKIERIRSLKGIKQDDLAAKIGMSQSALSKLEQCAEIDDVKLKLIADALEVNPDAIKNFNEDAAINNVQNNYDSAVVNSQINYQYNPLDKLVEIMDENKKLYERLLASEREKIKYLEALLKNKK